MMQQSTRGEPAPPYLDVLHDLVDAPHEARALHILGRRLVLSYQGSLLVLLAGGAQAEVESNVRKQFIIFQF